jgi:uncharacterized protein (TIGR03437 family)
MMYQFRSCNAIFLLSAAIAVPCGVAQTVAVSPLRINFTMTADSAGVPAPQTFQVTSSTGNVPFSVASEQTNDCSKFPPDPVFVVASQSSAMTPATVTVSLMPVTLTWGYGVYCDVVAILDGSGSYLAVDVILDVGLPPPPTVSSVLHAASLQPGVSPGEIVSIFGDHIGPGIPAGGYQSSSANNPSQVFYSAFIGNSKVAFNGYLAPLLYAGVNQINAVVPYEIAGQTSVQMVVSHDFVDTTALTVPVVNTAPGIFTVTENGSGQGAILNQDSTLNGAQNPAAAGSVIQIFATGAGVWNPPVPDGLEVSDSGSPYPVPVAAVSVSIGGLPAKVQYAGAAPDLVSGMLQVNAVVPAGLATGNQPVVLTVGRNSNAGQSVTVVVQ